MNMSVLILQAALIATCIRMHDLCPSTASPAILGPSRCSMLLNALHKSYFMKYKVTRSSTALLGPNIRDMDYVCICTTICTP